MSKSQKNICIFVCLLILLIILCTLTHMGSVKVSKPAHASATDAQSVVAPTAKNPINFTITKEDKKLSVSGDFDQQSNYDKLVAALNTSDLSTEVHVNAQLAPAEEVIALTEKLLVPFKSKYHQGSIRYQDGQLIVDGIVKDRTDKNQIAMILANSTIPSIDNTKVIEPVKEEVIEMPKVATPVPVEINETNTTVVPAVVNEVNQTLPTVPEVNITLPEVPEVPEVEAKVPEVASEEVKQIEAEIQKIIDFENINFELNSAELTTKSIATVQKIATILNDNSHVNVEIAGHTDSSGEDQHNLTLSQKRVDQVKQELITLGISEERMRSVGYGETRPLVANDTKENREKNRRVEFNIIGE